MTISRAKPAGWGIGEKLTSGQQNQVDINTTYALDKRSGQTDTLESIVSCADAGRIIDVLAVGANANTTYLANTARRIRLNSTITANREYTLSNLGALAGDVVTIFSESSFGYEITVKDQAAATLLKLGNGGSSDARWAHFFFDGAAWRVLGAGDRGPASQYILTGVDVSGSYTVPSDCYYVDVMIVGGGGGGGSGTGPAAAFVYGGGGGGGGTALHTIIPVTPGETLSTFAGAGGIGAAGAPNPAVNADGFSGSASTLTRGATRLAYASSGAGGTGAIYSGGSAYHAPGGRPGITNYSAPPTLTVPGAHYDLPIPGQGGWGTVGSVDSRFRNGSNFVELGGGHGGNTANGTGGGGGGGSGFPGAVGGAGGAAWSGAGVTPAGAAGTFGAGGGGGGGNGSAAGGAGGAGGNGVVVITPLY